jgi:hypothetical protein
MPRVVTAIPETPATPPPVLADGGPFLFGSCLTGLFPGGAGEDTCAARAAPMLVASAGPRRAEGTPAA